MTNWYYYDKIGGKIGPINSTALKTLVQQGLITTDTIIENEQGKSAKAGTIKGLEFPQQSVYSVEQPTPLPPVKFDLPPLPQATSKPAPIPLPVSPNSRKVISKPIIFVIVGSMILLCFGIITIMVIGSMKWSTPKQEIAEKQNETPTRKETSKSTTNVFKSILNQQTVIIEDIPSDDGTEFMKKYRSLFYSEDLAKGEFKLYRAISEDGNRLCKIFVENYNKQNIVQNIRSLQEIYDQLIDEFLDAWHSSIKYSEVRPEFSVTLSIMKSELTKNNVYNNLEKCMSLIKNDIKKLNKKDKEKTLELYAILSQYKDAVTKVEGSYNSYRDNRNSYRENFSKTLSLAELEW
jgi:hypothetical protein